MRTISHAMDIAVQHHQAGRFEQAERCYREILSALPVFAQAHFNLGALLQECKRPEEATECYGRALSLQPDHFGALSNLASVYHELGNFDAAIDCGQRAIKLRPGLAETHNNLGMFFLDKGSLLEAEQCIERALNLAPQDATARCSHSLLLLLKGDLQRGWEYYEWRSEAAQTFARGFQQPRWQGEALQGRPILLHAEQGIGDTFQFVRYAAIVKERGGTVVVECQRGLKGILGRCWGIDLIVEQAEELPAFDVHLPLMSLPRVLGTTLDTIPAEVPYVFADAGLMEKWSDRLSAALSPHYSLLPTPYSRPRSVGINWRGRPGKGLFRQRDIPLELFAELAHIPGVRLISLQRGEGREELLASSWNKPLLTDADGADDVSGITGADRPETHPTIVDLGDDVDAQSGAFMDTAAIMMNLDLAITSDTAVAHLAGALGVPVWVALPFAPDWRWLLERSDSPWYPTMRLFRQPRSGDWGSVFREIAEALRAVADCP